MSDTARGEKKGRGSGEAEAASREVAPLYSHIRELAPRAEVEVDPESTNAESAERGGFFAQATKISMGSAFPALRTVARFLSLETYRSLPKHDKLPDLEEEIIEAELDDLLEPEEEESAAAVRLLDWDEMEPEDLKPSPYQLYLFDLRIEEYLRQTKTQLSDQLTRKS